RDEAVEMRCDRDQEIRFFLVGEARRLHAGGREALVQRRIGGREPARELAVEAGQGCGVVEIFEGKPESGREGAGSLLHRFDFSSGGIIGIPRYPSLETRMDRRDFLRITGIASTS